MITTNHMVIIANTVGLIGDALLILAYFLLQSARIDARHLTYFFLNLMGALMILFSLLFAWNLPAAIIEIVWAVISILGIWRIYFKRRC